MADKQMEKIASNAMTAMAKRLADESKKGIAPKPRNKADTERFVDEWGRKMDTIRQKIERREKSGYYKQHPEAAKADWEECYYARLLFRSYADSM